MQDPHDDKHDAPEPTLLEGQRHGDGDIPIAGVVPVIMHGAHVLDWEIMVMRPHKPRFKDQPWEIGKGKRQILDNGQWRDPQKGEKFDEISFDRREPLYECAKREGAQELGLKKENISKAYDAADHCMFKDRWDSANAHGETYAPSEHGERIMRLFAVHVKDRDDFNKPSPDELGKKEVDECKWMPVQEFLKVGRPDHQIFIREMIATLSQAHPVGFAHTYRGTSRPFKHAAPLPAELPSHAQGEGWGAKHKAESKSCISSVLSV